MNVKILITTMVPALTFQEFAIRIKKAMEALKNITSAEVESVSEIFLRYISLRTTQFRVSLTHLIVVVCGLYIIYVYYIYYILCV